MDQYAQRWAAEINGSEKCYNYRMFKDNIELEKYLILMSKLRLCNHKLPVEQGRYRNIARIDRTCDKCNDNKLGDEYHFLLECSFFNDLRIKYIPKYYWRRPNSIKFKQLLSSHKNGTMMKISKFIMEGMGHYR
jgi:hypothetical protein